ncbi:MAG TPA: fused MFS/spermidine synthase [Vicinamibacterales bacterium]|jgi:spermidine synthase
MSTNRERSDRRGARRHRAAAVDGGLVSVEPASLPRFLPVLLLLFVASGAAALIYEIVWFQLLQLVIGSSAVSLGILLGTFMGGMCAGSLLLPRVVPPRHHPLRVYASIELGIGAIGLLVLWLMPLVGRVYLAWGGEGLPGLLLRGAVAALCLLPPTLLMGATLPAVARSVDATSAGMSWLGYLYGGNIAGGVCGCLLAAFYLLRVYDTAIATYAAVAVNAAVAAIALALPAVATGSSMPGSVVAFAQPRPGRVHVVIGLSGFTALAAEVIWTRQLALLFGGSVYAFAIILAVFLVGLGAGSAAASFLCRHAVASAASALGVSQLLLAAAIAWTAAVINTALPFWPIAPSISGIAFNFQLDVTRAFLALFPAAVLWGASFPFALAAAAADRTADDQAALVGGVYASNTVGAIAGALSASFVLVGSIGSRHAQQLLMVVCTIAGLLLLLRTPASGIVKRSSRSPVALAAAVALLALAVTVPPVSSWLVAFGRFAPGWVGLTDIIYVGEGMHSSVAVSRDSTGVLKYHASGKVQASSTPQDMRLQRMLGHLTTLLPANPRSVFVIGYGAGVTAGALSIDPRVERITIAEIEPLVPRVVSRYFADVNQRVAESPKLEVRVDDGRHAIQTSREKFDAVTTDLVDPWVKGTAALFTREFFETVRDHLNGGGIVTMFVQLYETSPEAVKSEVATFADVFPNSAVFGNTREGRGYDLVLVGQVEPLRIDLDEIENRLASPAYAGVAQSLREVGFPSAVQLLATYAGRPSELGEWLRGAIINRDRDLRLEYLAGMGMNLFENDRIYADILTYRRFPENLFAGSDARMQALWDAGGGSRTTP